jgi:hypothetical protein
MIIDQILWAAGGELVSQGTAPSPPSPEVLKALTELMNSIRGSASASHTGSWWTPEGLTAVAAFLASIAWPIIALIVVLKFRHEFRTLLSRTTKIEWLGLKAELQAELNKAAEGAIGLSGRSRGASAEELKRALKVEEKIADRGDAALVRQQVESLAKEYEDIRSSMPSGDARTRRMEVVMSKMRAIGRAAFPMRYELIQSPSPGQRLQAIASLQVHPDFDLLEWLADRIRVEKPFVGYHAVVALNTAARDAHAREHLNELEIVLERAKQASQGLSPDTDRIKELAQLGKTIGTLRAAG